MGQQSQYYKKQSDYFSSSFLVSLAMKPEILFLVLLGKGILSVSMNFLLISKSEPSSFGNSLTRIFALDLFFFL